MILHHERVTADTPSRWMLFLPGIYGAGRNWASVARKLLRVRPDWGAVLVDLRQHGASQGLPPPHSLEAAAADLRALVLQDALEPDAVLGHSFGGKVALISARGPITHLRQLWIVDSTPDAGPPGGSAWDMLGVLRAAPDSFSSRNEGVRALEERGVAGPVAQWMATNLQQGNDGRWRWRLVANDMEALLLDFFRTDAWDVVENPPAGVEIHFVKAEESSVLDEPACERIEEAGRTSGRVFLHRVPGGHWVNADSPDELVRLLSTHL